MSIFGKQNEKKRQQQRRRQQRRRRRAAMSTRQITPMTTTTTTRYAPACILCIPGQRSQPRYITFNIPRSHRSFRRCRRCVFTTTTTATFFHRFSSPVHRHRRRLESVISSEPAAGCYDAVVHSWFQSGYARARKRLSYTPRNSTDRITWYPRLSCRPAGTIPRGCAHFSLSLHAPPTAGSRQRHRRRVHATVAHTRSRAQRNTYRRPPTFSRSFL